MKRRININYPALRGMDIGFSNSLDVPGVIIRTVINGIKQVFNREIENHAFFVTESWGQFFATEMQPPRIAEHSLEKYVGFGNRIVSVFRWRGYDDPAIKNQAQARLAEIRRRDAEHSGYDFSGLVRFTKYVKYFLPWIKNDPAKDFCSEQVDEQLRVDGCKLGPFVINGEKMAPDPWRLADWFRKHPEEFKDISKEIIQVI
jgi:hypothetical protein